MLYFLPSIVAVGRDSDSKMQIFLVNLFIGWTFLGWVVALVWAVGKDKEYQA
jgi:hypothetical protein